MPYAINIKPMSSLEKCFLDERLDSKPEKNYFVVFKNQKLAFQIGVECDDMSQKHCPVKKITAEGELAPYVKISQVSSVPSILPVRIDGYDEDYIRTTPGLYPEMISPLPYEGCLPIVKGILQTLWIELELPEGICAGEYNVRISFKKKGDREFDGSEYEDTYCDVTVRVADASLPPQELIHTEWFYTDCLAEYYEVKAFSEKHWKIIENFISMAVKNGINMILTPIFTPELDTYIGGERLTTQLVDITVNDDGSYSFDFRKVDRWIDMCERLGVKYYEMPHFFTQWGALHAPKFVAKVKGRTKRIFGWETDSMGEEYRAFLGEFIPALLEYLKERGVDRRCYFHISDEPRIPSLEMYKKCSELIDGLLGGKYPVIDALSDYAFYETGALKKPVPSVVHAQEFYDNNVPDLWVYYCGAGGMKTYTNRYFAMSLQRVRALGVQLYKYDIKGFLHWGYNFYNSRYSYDRIEPALDSDSDCFGPSGDSFLVYPARDGSAMASIRLNAMREAVDDQRALSLCEKLYGREFTHGLIEKRAGYEISFAEYPKDADFYLGLAEEVALLAEKYYRENGMNEKGE